MGDDFDLFPKRENLDPFSFGKKETTSEPDKEEGGDDLFGKEEQGMGELPDLPADLPADLPTDLSSDVAASPTEAPSSLPGLPFDEPAPVSSMPPLQPPPLPTPTPISEMPDAASGSADSSMGQILSDGPISEEKTFDEPMFEQEQVVEDKAERSFRKSPSPFVIIGGALIIIIGLLYGALTFLKRDKPQVPVASLPTVSVAVAVSKPEPAPVPKPAAAEAQVQPETQLPAEVENVIPEPAVVHVQETAPVTIEPAPKSAQVAAAGTGKYSVQVGAFILDSSVAELEKKLHELGYEPLFKKGSTTAMMNMLTVGPFGNTNSAKAALSRLKTAGVDSNVRRRNDGSAIINAGSYLLEENATSIMKKIRSLGYPVKLGKREAKLPMTFVRVGTYPDMDSAKSVKTELKGKGLDGIIVKLR